MEFVGSVGITVALIICAIFFRNSLKKAAKYTEDCITTNITEEQVELVQRSMDAQAELIEECGEDFRTPEEVWRYMQKRRRRVRQSA